MSLNLNSGAVSGKSQHWKQSARAAQLVRGLAGDATLDLRFPEEFYYRKSIADGEDALYPSLAEMAVHSRASGATYPNWDLVSGSIPGRLIEYAENERRSGAYGALDEAAATNQIRNPRFEGGVVGVVGSGGVLPDNITIPDFGVPIEILKIDTVNGWPRLRLKITGTPTSVPRFFLEDTTAVAAAQGQTWTGSLGVSLVAGTWPDGDANIRMIEYTAAAGYIAEYAEDIVPDAEHRRYVQTHTIVSGTAAHVRFDFYTSWTSGPVDFTVDLFLPQLEQAASPSSPILPPKGAPAVSTRAADVVTGFSNSRTTKGWADSQWEGGSGDKCGVLQEFLSGVNRSVAQGLRVHQSSTNEVRNPRGEGAVVGAPGTLPTHWSAMFSGGSVEVTGAGVENGYPYTEIRFHAASPTGNPMITFEALGYTAAAFDQKWSQSVGVKLVGGNLENIDGLYQRIWQRNSSNSLLTILSGPVETFDTAHRRFTNTEQLDAASVASIQPYLEFSRVPGNPVDFTVRLYCPQAENAAFASDVILPPEGTLAASTRSAERLQLTDLSWYAGDEAEGTMVVEGIAPYGDNSVPTASVAYLEGVVAARGRHLGYRNDLQSITVDHRQDDATITGQRSANGSYPSGSPFRASTSWDKVDPIEWTYDGAQGANMTALTGAVTIEALWIGYGSAGGSTPLDDFFNGTIKAIKYFPRKLTEAEQQAQTV